MHTVMRRTHVWRRRTCNDSSTASQPLAAADAVASVTRGVNMCCNVAEDVHAAGSEELRTRQAAEP